MILDQQNETEEPCDRCTVGSWGLLDGRESLARDPVVSNCLASFHRNRWVWVTGQVQDKGLIFLRVGFTVQTPIIMHSHAVSLWPVKSEMNHLGADKGTIGQGRTHPNHSFMGVSWQQEESIHIWLFALVLQIILGRFGLVGPGPIASIPNGLFILFIFLILFYVSLIVQSNYFSV